MARSGGLKPELCESETAEAHPTSDAAARLLLAAIFDSTSDAVISFDVEGRIKTWNRAAEALFGYTAREVIGRDANLLVKPLGFVPPGETERGAFDCALAGGRYECDTQRVAKDGTVIDVALTATQIRAEDGRVLGVSSIFRDIRRRKQIEAELRASETRLASLVQSAMDAIISIDASQCIQAFNPAAERMFAIAADEVLGQPLDRLVPARLRERHKAHVRSFMVSTETSRRLGEHGEIVAVRQNGEEFPVEVSISRVASGSSWQYCAVLRDITERERSEATLRQSEERLRTFIRHAPAAIAMFDREMRYLAVSPNWIHYFCPAETDLVGRCHYDVFPEIGEAWKEVHRRAIAGEVLKAEDDPFPRSDGRMQYVRWEVRPWRGVNGEIGGITVFAEDISRRVVAENNLRREREDLDRAQAVARTGSWRLNIITNQLTWSAENHRLFGVPEGERMTYESFLGKTHPDDRGYVDREWQAALKGTPYDVEHRIVVDGEIKWVRERANLEFDANGRLLGGFGTTQDVTDSKKAAQALAWNARRNALLSDTATRLLESANPQREVESLCYEVMIFLDCHVFFNFLADEKAGRMHLNACAGISRDEARKIEWLDYGVAVCGCAARDRRRIIAENIACCDDPRTTLVKSYGVEAYCCHPLMVRGQLLGTLSFGTRARSSFSDDDIGVMKAVADLVAMAMHRLKTERALRESEEQLRQLGDNLPNSMVYRYVVERDGTRRFAYVSSGIERLNGVSVEAVLGNADLLHRQVLAESWPQLLEAERRSARDLRDFSIDVPMRHPDGEVRWMRLQSRPRRLPDGGVMWDGVQTDVTERKRADAELGRVRYLLTEGQRIAHLGSFEFIAATQETVWSDEQKRIYGLDPKQASPAYEVMLRQHIHPDDAAELDRAFKEAFAKGAVFENENRIVRPDGSIRWIQNRAHPHFDAGGKLVRYVGATLDITDRKSSEDALREREEQLRLSTEAGGVGPFTVELPAGIVRFSAKTASMVGFPERRITTVNEVAARVHRDDLLAVRSAYEQALDPAGRGTIQVEVRFVRPGGEIRWMQCGGRVEFDDTCEGSVPRRLLGVCVDTTERRRMIEALASANSELERKVEERTEALALEMEQREKAQQRLAQAQRMEATGRLTSGLAHDFNNTLAAVAAHLEMAEVRADDDVARECIRHALDAVELGASLNRRLLSIAHKTAHPPTVGSLTEPLNAVVSLIGRTLGKDIAVVLDVDKELWPVKVDRGEFESAILNLAINARDAMSGGGEILVGARNVSYDAASLPSGVEKPGDYVRVDVRDTGIGMSPEVLAVAAEPFFTTKSATKGTGLGLSSVREFLGRSDGVLTIESARDLGTLVTLLFPRASGKMVEAPRPVERADQVPLGDGELVLLVDDDERVLEATHRLLEGLGYAVAVARDGVEAIAMLETVDDVRLVLSDVVMHGAVSGFDVARRVRADFPSIGVVLVSGYYDFEGKPDDTREMADVPVIAKPFSRADIGHALKAALA